MSTSHPLSATFAKDLQEFLHDALPVPSNLTTVGVDDGLLVGPQAAAGSARFGTIALDGTESSPRLRVEYKLCDDPSGDFFRVTSSTFGLLAPTDKGGVVARPVPILRVEFERSQSPPAHIHFHTSSQTLGWIYGRAGGAHRRAEDLHFPIGSQRFRPTIEEFLLFLDHERLFRDWRSGSGWRQRARERIAEYERRQALATVRHYPADIAEELRRIGWSVTPPDTA